MKEIIDKIIEQSKEIFGDNIRVEKVNVGFTNTIYIVNDKYVVKICTNYNNEKGFEKDLLANDYPERNLIAKCFFGIEI